ncbi:MAG: SRPBCC family protein [Pseudolysinimonas sp.]
MPVTSVSTDAEALTLTLVAEFPVPVERLWEAFADPRKLERFWGPPGYPSTFGEFDFRPGGTAHYRMTSPQGEDFHGLWKFGAVDAPHSIDFVDWFADANGVALPDMPVARMALRFETTTDGCRLTTVTNFDTPADLEKVIAMGVVEGSTLAMAQLDAVLADLREYALGKGTRVELIDDVHVRITRAFEAPRHLIWRAHTEPELMKQWLLGPDGWTMTVCEVSTTPGGSYRYAWEPEDASVGSGFGFDGETLVVEPERRIVTTERMTGADFPATTNDLSFDEDNGVTLLTLYITYADLAQRDAILATGMTEGMETSYQRLERELLPIG